MSAAHTPAPWDVTAEPGLGVYVHATDAFDTDVAEMICTGHSDEAVVANARRIVACVNACDGIPTEVLEAGRVADQLWVHLKSQRDELLVALRHIEGAAMDFSCERASIRDAARAAIAKAEGRAA